jgi:undecaprenyl-diphosphatase
MTYIDAIILGLIQGMTEFIPVSSSGHLVIASKLLGIDNSFTFDVLINFGTLSALIYFYKSKLKQIIGRMFSGKEWKFVLKIIVATLPAVVIGILFDYQIEKLNDYIWVVIIMLIVLGVIFILFGKPNQDANNQEVEKSATWKRSIIIGIAQAIALIPGTSRSGITTLAGLRLNLSASKAAEFSFLLAIPIITAASFKMLLSEQGRSFVIENTGVFVVGNIVSFTAGLISVSFFISLLSKRGLRDFGWYRLGLATVLIILTVTGVI